MKTLTEITLYDLMAEDLTIWITKNSKFGFDLQIDNDENCTPLVNEKGVHPFAADSLALFCAQYLGSYERATKEAS